MTGQRLRKDMEIVDVVIPSFYPGERLIHILDALERQTVRPRCVRIINTEREGLERLLRQQGLTECGLQKRYPAVRLEHIRAEEYDHGATRSRGFLACGDADYVLTMTQDALPKDDGLISRLLEAMRGCRSDPGGAIAVSYARQIPNEDAPAEERLSREFNYPAQSRTKSGADLPQLGVKTYFCSNVCAMYRLDIWRELGGFPSRAIFNEDMVYAAKALKAGYRIRYEAGAQVFHSHSYTAGQQFHRNFDLGVSQEMNPQVFAGLSSEGEGVAYVKAVTAQLCAEHALTELPGFLWRAGWRLIGYRLGKSWRRLPRSWVVRFSSNRNFWDSRDSARCGEDGF